MGRVQFDVGGVTFALDKSFLQTGPESKLKRMYGEADLTEQVTPFILNRPPDLFGAIVTFYVTGDLHIPMTSCPEAFIKELEFWEIDESYITPCCSFRLGEFKDRQRKLTLFQKQMTRSESDGLKIMSCGSLAKKRAALWSFMENKDIGTFIELYFVLLFAMIILSVLTVSLGTTEGLQRNLTNCERLYFMEARRKTQSILFAQFVNKTNCGNTTLPDFISHQDNHSRENKDYLTVDLPRPSDNQLVEVKIPIMTVPDRTVVWIDLFTLAFFTVDLILRLISCPNLIEYFKSFINIMDAAALFFSYLYLVLVQVFGAETRDEDLLVYTFTCMLVLRALRLLRIIRGIREGRVLAFTLFQIVKELWVILILIITAVFIFASLVYASEIREPYMFEDIPTGMYWAVITLTTVGYGDIRPITGGGKLYACLCAVSGVILFALTIPVFTNQFLLFNRYSSLKFRSGKSDVRPRTAVGTDVTERLIGPHSTGSENQSQPEYVELAAV